jgi:hypothetical protein
MKKHFNRKAVAKYFYNQLTGNFTGFIVAVSASGLVSKFFETRSIRNLWGLTSKKTVVDKSTFAALEWFVSILIGFIVFEIMTKVVKERIDRHLPFLKTRLLRFLVHIKFRSRSREYLLVVRNTSSTTYSFMQQRARIAFARFRQ